jgi:hypothetical protein
MSYSYVDENSNQGEIFTSVMNYPSDQCFECKAFVTFDHTHVEYVQNVAKEALGIELNSKDIITMLMSNPEIASSVLEKNLDDPYDGLAFLVGYLAETKLGIKWMPGEITQEVRRDFQIKWQMYTFIQGHRDILE